MSVPESYLQPCLMQPVESDATDYEQAFLDVSVAYAGSARNVAECNIRYEEALRLMKAQKERYSEPQ